MEAEKQTNQNQSFETESMEAEKQTNPNQNRSVETEYMEAEEQTNQNQSVATESMGTEKQVILSGMDDSDHSFHALEWTLDHFFTPFASDCPFKLVVLHAKPTPVSAVGLAGIGTADMMPYVENDLKLIAARVVEKSNSLLAAKSVADATVEVVEGDARNVLCEGVEKHHATILVVGSHGYGAIKRAVLGSVSDYCAHHAHCSVLIVKKPKAKH